MRYRIKNYTTSAQTVILNDVTLNSIEDLRLVINLTQGIVIYSPMDRSGIEAVMERGFVVETNVCTLNEKTPDQLLIEIDKGDKIEIDTTDVAKETTLNSAKEEILTAVENAKPEVDLSGVAKQGEKPEATNSKILEEIGNVAAALTTINDTLGTL